MLTHVNVLAGCDSYSISSTCSKHPSWVFQRIRPDPFLSPSQQCQRTGEI